MSENRHSAIGSRQSNERPADTITTFRDLRVWQKAYGLTKEIYLVSQDFPREELYGLTTQIRRAAISIPANIAEGYGRRSTQDYIRFLNIAHASGTELYTHLLLAKDLGFGQAPELERCLTALNDVLKMLYGLARKVDGS